ncbi:hypothetical protein BDY19DRAFT_213494 [Irpex rosettiformis]|uniref:Uncharacterized protein n=1 Tax=Irpex rosettiformis TaxID=378272 RepID=A0ACB8U234_9APHY|nr:hypothetical protein BDY19DRAFT_213494 [Irpex rosettiformis]
MELSITRCSVARLKVAWVVFASSEFRKSTLRLIVTLRRNSQILCKQNLPNVRPHALALYHSLHMVHETQEVIFWMGLTSALNRAFSTGFQCRFRANRRRKRYTSHSAQGALATSRQLSTFSKIQLRTLVFTWHDHRPKQVSGIAPGLPRVEFRVHAIPLCGT